MHSKTYSKIEEYELLELAKAGKQFAYSEIMRRFENKVAGTVFGMLGKTQEAEDVCQNVFIRFFKSMEQFRGDSAMGTYITRIAINLSLNEIKKNSKHSFFDLESIFKKNKSDFIEQSKIHSLEGKEIVQAALNKLEPKFRSVIVLRIIDGYSTKETSEILNTPVGTVLSRLSRAQEKLKTILTPLMEE